MGGTKVGGNPTTIAAAASQLHKAKTSVETRPAGITSSTRQGETGAGDAVLSAALARFNAAYGQFVSDVGIELNALATLADSSAADLNKAGGE